MMTNCTSSVLLSTLLCICCLATTLASSAHRKLRHTTSYAHGRNLQSSDTQFCGRTWGDAIADCSPSTHCPNGNDDCAPGETCHTSLPGCNINDMSAQQQQQPSGNTAPAGSPTPPPIRNEYDERNMKFCGPSWSEANDSCSLNTWCPTGNECDAGQTCWGGVAKCNAFKLLEENGGDAPWASNTSNNENNGGGGESNNGNDMGMGGGTTQQCSPEVYQCENGQFVARAPELNCGFYPCPVQQTEETNAPTDAPVLLPTDPPTDSPERVTFKPTMNPTVWVDNDASEVGSTNNHIINETSSGGNLATTTTNLWCGESRFDAGRNCGRKGYECADGYCLQDLSCFMISNQCEIAGSETTAAAGAGATGDVSDTYFCGISHADAVSSCHKRCRSGSPADCPAGESCFRNVYQCSVEIPRADPTPKPTSPPTLSPVVTMTEAPSRRPTDDNVVNTASPTVGFGNIQVQPPPNLPGLYCASSMNELEVSCATAQQCGGSEPCPLGQMCYPYECKGSSDSATLTTTAKPTLPPAPAAAVAAENIPPAPESGGSLGWFCGSSYNELETTCSTTSQKCSAERQDCPFGQWCFQYYCNAAMSESEDTVVENDAPEPNQELNNSVQQQIQSSEPSYCASSIAQLDERCGLASQCASDSDCIVESEVCMKYDCRQNLMLCPLNFVGWHSSKDCKQYYYCEQGVSSSSDSCGDGMKFDKTRDKCTTDYVDELCYGLASYEHDSGPITQPGTAKDLCPPGFTGWHSGDGACNEYQKCTAGNPGPTRVCGFGLKFDTARGQCIDEALVNIELCEGPLPQGSLCPSWKFIGWGVKDDCAEYFYCKNGNTDFVERCADGLLFDMQAGICKPADAVNCGGPNLPSNSVADAVSNSNTPTPTPMKDLESSFEWSNTTPPTISQEDSKLPPWMFFKKDHSGTTRKIMSLQMGLFTLASISWVLL